MHAICYVHRSLTAQNLIFFHISLHFLLICPDKHYIRKYFLLLNLCTIIIDNAPMFLFLAYTQTNKKCKSSGHAYIGFDRAG